MRIPLRFKTPDAVSCAVHSYLEVHRPDGIDDEEYDAIVKDAENEAIKKIEKHVEYGEYLTVYYNIEEDRLELK